MPCAMIFSIAALKEARDTNACKTALVTIVTDAGKVNEATTAIGGVVGSIGGGTAGGAMGALVTAALQGTDGGLVTVAGEKVGKKYGKKVAKAAASNLLAIMRYAYPLMNEGNYIDAC